MSEDYISDLVDEELLNSIKKIKDSNDNIWIRHERSWPQYLEFPDEDEIINTLADYPELSKLFEFNTHYKETFTFYKDGEYQQLLYINSIKLNTVDAYYDYSNDCNSENEDSKSMCCDCGFPIRVRIPKICSCNNHGTHNKQVQRFCPMIELSPIIKEVPFTSKFAAFGGPMNSMNCILMNCNPESNDYKKLYVCNTDYNEDYGVFPCKENTLKDLLDKFEIKRLEVIETKANRDPNRRKRMGGEYWEDFYDNVTRQYLGDNNYRVDFYDRVYDY